VRPRLRGSAQVLTLPSAAPSGWAAASQFDRLHELFELHALRIPPANRDSLVELADLVVAHVSELRAERPGRPVLLFGESLGGLLAVAAAQRDGDASFHQLVLVNPATSFSASPWPTLAPLLPSLPPQLYQALPFALSPLLGDPFRVVASQLAAAAALPERGATTNSGQAAVAQPQAMAEQMLARLGRLGSLVSVLPPETLAFRVQELLGVGGASVAAHGYAGLPPAYVVVGGADRLLPSAAEGPRLARAWAAAGGAAEVHVVPGGSHALLQEGSTSLASLLLDSGVYMRALAEARAAAGPPPPPPRRAAAGIPLGEAARPSAAARARASSAVAFLRALVSPVFFSTAPGGRVVQGLAHLPTRGPLLFVGNHQLFAPDLGLLISEVLDQKGLLLRGLAHPAIFRAVSDGPFGGREAGSDFAAFGAVPVSGRALYSLLAAGEAALLFPGGVREAYKRRGEEYQLLWPRRAEFVRHAMRLGATIVPFAAVGAEDGFQILADAEALLRLPLLGDALRARAADVPAARAVDPREQEGGVSELFLPPLALPTPPMRYYFRFGEPIAAEGAGSADDAEAVGELYTRVQGEVRAGMDWLLARRGEDPFRELLPRALYEAASGAAAPTFRP